MFYLFFYSYRIFNLLELNTNIAIMSGVLCFVSQDGPFADETQNDAFFSSQENPTFVYRNEQEVNQVVSRTDPSTVQEPHTITRMATPNQASTTNKSTVNLGGAAHLLDIGPFWMLLGRIFNSTILSVIIIGVTVSVSIALGAVSVFVVKPSPYFDKSLDAFQIPNHDSTIRWEALDLAKKDVYLKRSKRSLAHNNGNDAITNDAIDNKLQLHSTPKGKNNKLFMKYQNSLPAPSIADFHNIKQNTESQPLSRYAPFVKDFQDASQDIESQPLSRRRRNIRRYRTTSWKLQLVYIAQGKGDLNIFTPDRLQTIHDIEMKIMKHDGFMRFCSRNYQSFSDPALAQFNYCSPPNSLMTYFYPSKIGNQVSFVRQGWIKGMV